MLRKITNNKTITLIVATVLLIVSATVFCSMETANPLTIVATAKVNAKGGAYLRKSTSTSSAKVKLLKDNSKITIKKEVFTSKKKTDSTYRWYYVTTSNGKKGYIRKDCVDSVNYTEITAQVIPGTNGLRYRVGVGTDMTKKGALNDYETTPIVLKAYQKGSSELWYKIRVGSKYYYACGQYLSTEIKEKPQLPDRAGDPKNPEKVNIPTFSGTAGSQINQMALYMAWPSGTSSTLYSYKKGYPTKEYAGIHIQWPKRTKSVSSTYGAGPMYGASCDRFVGCVVWATGFDVDFPSGSGFKKKQQGGYMKIHPEKWAPVYNDVENKKYTGDTSVLKPGDIVCDGVHIYIIVKVNGKLAIAEAALNSTYPHINTDLSKATKSGIKVYRAIDQ